jgi:hypothetical protein
MKLHPHHIKRIVFVMVMAMITTSLISFTIIALNLGFNKHFLMKWLQSWSIAYFMAVLAMLFIGPKVQGVIESVLKK